MSLSNFHSVASIQTLCNADPGRYLPVGAPKCRLGPTQWEALFVGLGLLPGMARHGATEVFGPEGCDGPVREDVMGSQNTLEWMEARNSGPNLGTDAKLGASSLLNPALTILNPMATLNKLSGK